MNAASLIHWLLAKQQVRKAFWRVTRIAQDHDLSMGVLAKPDWQASQERARVLRTRGMAVGPGTLIGRARFDAHVGSVEIGERCAILDDCVIIAHDVSGVLFGNLHVSKVRIGDNTVLMPGVYVLPGVDIGPNVVVAPRSVVAQSIPPNTFAAGHPARAVCSLDEWLAECERRLEGAPGLFTAIPSEGGFRDDLLRAWRRELPERGRNTGQA